MALRIGDKAPSFDVTSHDGRRLKLETILADKAVVLYFYPKDFTTVCTQEACGFRDMYEDLQARHVEVIGVSIDTDASHKSFAAHHRVPFPLVADPDRRLARSYDAVSLLRGLMGTTGRVTYVIDRKGNIAGVFDSALLASRHLDGVKATLKRIGVG